MAPTIDDQIRHFIRFGRQQVAQVMHLKGPDCDPTPLSNFRKLLLCAVVDGYSGWTRSTMGNRDRFMGFVRKFGQWPESERISLTHLSELLRRQTDPDLGPLRSIVHDRIAQWTSGSFIELSADLDDSQLMTLWPKSRNVATALRGVKIEQLRHVSLLYSYRCSLAHELQSPGFSFEVTNRSAPFYIHGTDVIGGVEKEGWMLVYPLTFFENLTLCCLDGLESYLRANGINPYANRNRGEFWVEALNAP